MSATRDVDSALMRQTLLDRDLVRRVDRPVVRLLPWLHVVNLGGRSIVDRGAEVLLPLVEELRAALAEHRMLILTGAGVRARHVLGVGLDLGLSTGALAGLAATEAEQNGHLVAALLAADGVSYLPHGAAAHQLATHLAASRAVVSNGYPPFGHHEFPAPGKLPLHRSDAGTLLLADAYGAARTVYVKDVDGVRPDGPDGDVAERIDVARLRDVDPVTLPVDPYVLDLLTRTTHVREIQVVNGTVPGRLTRALRGEPVGTVITS